MIRCPYCNSENITQLVPVRVTKPRKLFKYEYSQHCEDCGKEFNQMSRMVATYVDPKQLLFLSTLPSSGELKTIISETYNSN